MLVFSSLFCGRVSERLPSAKLPGETPPRSEESSATKGAQVRLYPRHYVIKRRRKTISVIAKLVRSAGAILRLCKPASGPIIACLESLKRKEAEYIIILHSVSFTILKL